MVENANDFASEIAKVTASLQKFLTKRSLRQNSLAVAIAMAWCTQAGMSCDLGRDVPGAEKLYPRKLWADFSLPRYFLHGQPGAFLQTPAPALDRISGPKGAGFLSNIGLGFGTIIDQRKPKGGGKTAGGGKTSRGESLSLTKSLTNSQNFPQVTPSKTVLGGSPKIVSDEPSLRGFAPPPLFCPPHWLAARLGPDRKSTIPPSSSTDKLSVPL